MPGKTALLKILTKGFFITTTAVILWGCVQPQPATSGDMAPTPAGQQNLSQEEQALLADQAAAQLQNTDCSKCHDSQPTDIVKNGGKHKTAIGCLDCHLEHLPLGKETIPQCSMCHDASAQKHFAVGDRTVCLGCHRNPHTPLDVTVDDVPAVSLVCKTCHAEKGDEFAKFPSKHAQKNCTHCHPTKHKQIQKCLTCHEPHAKFMVYDDCLRCHKPHSPLDIRYADDTPSQYCGACHTELFEMLSKSKAKHGEFNCAFCHKTKHPTVPNCSDCHANPHDSSVLTAFNSDCLKCHRNPHDLIY